MKTNVFYEILGPVDIIQSDFSFKVKAIFTATVKEIIEVREQVLPTRKAGSPRLWGRGVPARGPGWKQWPAPFSYVHRALEVRLPIQSRLHFLTYLWVSKATQALGISSWHKRRKESLSLSLTGFLSLLGPSVTHQASVSMCRTLPREKYRPEGKWQHVPCGASVWHAGPWNLVRFPNLEVKVPDTVWVSSVGLWVSQV